MTSRPAFSPLVAIFLCVICVTAPGENRGILMEWEELPSLPRTMGGQFVGSHGNALIVAGGTDWEGSFLTDGVKVWMNKVHVLEPGAKSWIEAGTLPEALSYGAAVTTEDGMICIGGSDGKRNQATVRRLQWRNRELALTPMPDLPKACAMCCAGIVGDVLYVAGGMESPDATSAMRTFWALDLRNPAASWEELEPWPGPARILAAGVAQSGGFHIFSGADLTEGADGKAVRTYLTDGYRYEKGIGWKTVAAMPRAAVAAPAIAYGPSHILVFTGDDGALVDRVRELGDNHPGFPKDVLAYHTITDTWAKMGEIPVSLVTTGAVLLSDRIVIAGGEPQPGHRSATVYSGKPTQARKGFGTLDYVAMSVYFVALVVIGVYFSKRENSTEDYFLGGQRVPWWAAGISIYGTLLSAITFLSVPATAFSTDWVYSIGNIMGILVAPIVVYFYLPFFRGTKITTAYEYLEKRFNLAVRMFGGLAFVIFQLGRMGIVLYLPALALSAVTGVDISLAIIVMGVLCTFYTVMGGIEAVIWTDVIQVVVLLGGALLALFIVGTSVDGGFAAAITAAAADHKFRIVNWGWDYTLPVFWVVVIGRFLEAFIPFTTDQTVIQRYLTTPSEKDAARSIWTGAICGVPSFIVFFGIGTALYVFYKGNPELLDPSLKTDQIFPLFIVQQLPSGISGLVIAAVFAAAMSSLDSSMNSVSAVLVTDFYRRFKTDVRESSAMSLARYLTICLGVIATAIALWMAFSDIASIWEQYMKIIALFGGSLVGVFALGIFTRRANGLGALIGAVVCVGVLEYVRSHSQVNFLLHAAIGTATGFGVGYLASMFVGRNKSDLTGLCIWTRRRSQNG